MKKILTNISLIVTTLLVSATSGPFGVPALAQTMPTEAPAAPDLDETTRFGIAKAALAAFFFG